MLKTEEQQVQRAGYSFCLSRQKLLTKDSKIAMQVSSAKGDLHSIQFSMPRCPDRLDSKELKQEEIHRKNLFSNVVVLEVTMETRVKHCIKCFIKGRKLLSVCTAAPGLLLTKYRKITHPPPHPPPPPTHTHTHRIIFHHVTLSFYIYCQERDGVKW